MKECYRTSYWYIDLLGAVLCGILIGVIQDLASHSGDEVTFSNFMRTVQLAVASYSAVALLLICWKRRPLRLLPNWYLIIVLGALTYYFCIHLVDTVTYASRFRYTQPELSLPEYFLSYVLHFGLGLAVITVLDFLLALPLMGAIQYVGAKLVKRLSVSKVPAA